MSFSGKVVIVTGASSGIGEATAVLFAREGANVVAVGRNETKLKEVTNQIAKVGKAPLVIKADVGVDSEAKRIIDETVAKYGKIDVLVNNAGFTSHGTILEGNIVEAYDAVMRVNVRSVIKLTTLATPYLIKTNGNIVNISSVLSHTLPKTSLDMTSYAVSKAALDHFTKAAAAELGPKGVRVNSVNPGPVVTDFLTNSGTEGQWDDYKKFTVLHRVSASEEIADLIAYVASAKANGMTGSIILSDNGYLIK